MENLIEKFKELFGMDEATKSERLRKAATDRANKIYTIIKKGDNAIVYAADLPASVEWEQHPEALLYRLRDMYVEKCIEMNELI